MNNFPCIKVIFTITCQFDIQQIAEEIGIFPYKKREIEDWPEVIRNNANLPEELCPRCEWSISQEEKKCISIERPIYKIISQLAGKEEIITNLCKEWGLETSLCIVVHAETMKLPEIVLSAETVSYFGSMKTEIGFDLYVY